MAPDVRRPVDRENDAARHPIPAESAADHVATVPRDRHETADRRDQANAQQAAGRTMGVGPDRAISWRYFGRHASRRIIRA